MLRPATRLRLQGILERIGNDQPVSLQERIYLQKFADHDQSVASWLRQARRRRHLCGSGDGLDRFLDVINLSPSEPDDIDRPDDEIEGRFRGAPGWVRRSCPLAERRGTGTFRPSRSEVPMAAKRTTATAETTPAEATTAQRFPGNGGANLP